MHRGLLTQRPAPAPPHCPPKADLCGTNLQEASFVPGLPKPVSAVPAAAFEVTKHSPRCPSTLHWQRPVFLPLAPRRATPALIRPILQCGHRQPPSAQGLGWVSLGKQGLSSSSKGTLPLGRAQGKPSRGPGCGYPVRGARRWGAPFPPDLSSEDSRSRSAPSRQCFIPKEKNKETKIVFRS